MSSSAHRRGEGRVLGEESVAGMDRVGAGLLRGLDQRVGVEVAVPGAGRSDADGFVGRADVARRLVCRRVDGNRREPELTARPRDAQCDLTAVRDEDLANHGTLSSAR